MENEFSLLFRSLLLGAALGVFWDIFRIIRIAVNGRRKSPRFYRIRLPATSAEAGKAMSIPNTRFTFSDIPLFISDLVFCLAASVSLTLLLYSESDGKIRFFAIWGAIVGFAAYHFTVGKAVMFFSEAIISAIKKTLRFILRHTLFPVFRLGGRLLRRIGRGIDRVSDNIRTERTEKKLLSEALRGFGHKSVSIKSKDDKD